ncbi:Jerky-like protein, partial [Stegodyphus mimosarum]
MLEHTDTKELQDGNIKAMLLPPQLTAICQHIYQVILETIKRNYHRKLLSTVIDKTEEGQDIIEIFKRINVRDAAYWVKQAWADIKGYNYQIMEQDKGDDGNMKMESTDESIMIKNC